MDAYYKINSSLERRKPASGRTQRRMVGKAISIVVLVVFSCIFLAPFLWLVITALKTIPEMGELPIRWLPRIPQWINFIKALTEIDYGHYALNSLTLSLLFTIPVTLTSALVGFGFARLRGRGKQALFLIMLSTIMLPAMVTLIPTYIIFSHLGLIDTYWPWLIWGLATSPFFSFLFRQFFAGIPQELEEAAVVDGCGYWRIFWQIFLPLSTPVLATVAILAFASVWGDFLGPLIFLGPENTTLAVAMTTGYSDAMNHPFINILASGIIIYMVPILLAFLLAQRYFVRGIATSGLKG